MHTQLEILETIKSILVDEFDCPAEKLTPDVKLFEDLDLDSIDAVDLVIRLQKIINKKVNPEDFKQIRTLQDIVLVIEKIINEDKK